MTVMSLKIIKLLVHCKRRKIDMSLKVTDPEFIERFEYFAFNEVVNEESCQLETETRYTVVLAAIIRMRRRGRLS